MATVNDIDTKALVTKYLQRQVVLPSEDDQSDKAEEIQSLLETSATSFLLNPQMVMPLIFRGKNALQQIVRSDIEILDFLIGAIADIRNPDSVIEDVSDLVEAQTALVELDRLGRVGDELQAFRRYKAAVSRFLDNELAIFLKRNARKEFERSGIEAREDIFAALPQFGATHKVMADRLAYLQAAVSDFNSVDLNKVVSTRTIQEVRTSLRELKSLVERNALSKTVTATELLAGVASMEAVSDNIGIYDPTIDTLSSVPNRRSIYLRPEQVAATSLSTEGPWDASGSDRVFSVVVNPLSVAPVALELELPDVGVEDTSGDATVYVTSSEAAASPTYEIPASGTLFVLVEGSATPEQEVAITSGTRTQAQVLSDLNIGLVDAVAIAFKGTNRFLIYGDDPAITSIVIRGGSSGSLGVINTDPSVHEVLGFEPNQSSLARGVFDSESLKDALEGRITGASLSVEGSSLRITSDSVDTSSSSLEFSTAVTGDVQGVFGFVDPSESEPSYMELVENNTALDPPTLEVFIGSVVTAAEEQITGSSLRILNSEPISSIEGTRIYFSATSPRGALVPAYILSPDVLATQLLTQSLAAYVGSFDNDFQNLQLALSPILSSPTVAQVNDALRVLNRIRDVLTNDSGGVLEALEAVVVRQDRSPYSDRAETVISAFEERGLDRATELLSTGRFSDFFSLTKGTASRSSRLLSSMEDFITQDIPESFDEEIIDDFTESVGRNSDDLTLDTVEPKDPSERLVEDL